MNSHGVILIVTIWILAILVLFVLGLGFRMSLEARLTDYSVNTFRLFYLVKAAVKKFEAVLKEDESMKSDALNEDWSNNGELFKDIPLGDGTFTISYIREEGYSEEEEGEERKVFYGAIDEASRININTIVDGVIKGNDEYMDVLWNLVDERDDIVDSILDWVDKDIGGDVTRDAGAESDYYEGLDFPYPSKNGPFQSKEELLLVRGMTPEIFNNMKDLITIYGDGKINLYTADSRVMKVLGLNDDFIDNIIMARKGPDGDEGTSDDPIFTGTAYIKGLIPSHLIASEVARNASIIDNLTDLSSSHFRLHVTAKAKDGKIIKKAEVVVSRSDQESTIEFWHEY